MTPTDRAALPAVLEPARPQQLERLRGPIAGILAAAVALGVGQLVAVVTGAATSPLVTVGGAVIDAAPQAAKAFAIATFGEADKLALIAGIVVTLAGVAAGIGILATRSRRLGILGVLAFGIVAVLTAVTRPGAMPAAALPGVLGAVAGAGALAWLVTPIRRSLAPSGPSTSTDGLLRRTFLTRSAAVAALATLSGGAGLVGVAARAGGTPIAGPIPAPDDRAAAVSPGVDLGLAGVTPFVTPNASFYRVDTALIPPRIQLDDWRLRIHGRVERELTLTYDELLQFPTIERDITLTCVSNVVGGGYAGNARWIGVPLKALLDEVGVDPAADQLVSRSVDGMTIGTPTAVAMDGRDAMLAVAMNGQPLPVEHGYPVRMLVPGLYGYVSATKWLTELELTTFDALDPYWVQRGWAPQAPIKTMSRIDTPRPLSQVPAGTIPIAGVAWAQHRGITRVEVRVDDDPWMPARLAAVDTVDTWRQWVFDWAATPGRHSLSVRATDGSGSLQPEDRAEPFPDGATGWHTVVMTVT